MVSKGNALKAEDDTPSAEAKNELPKISSLSVKNTIFDEALRLERIGIGIYFLITSHAPVNAISTRVYLRCAREPTMH